jgi:hypothetical protein
MHQHHLTITLCRHSNLIIKVDMHFQLNGWWTFGGMVH